MSFREGVTFSRSQKLGILFAFALFAIGFSIVGMWSHFSNGKEDIEAFETYVEKADSIANLESTKKPDVHIIDINTADSAEWAQLPGIGAVLSKRIINYREAIGGFRSIAQLSRIYGLKPETLELISPYIEVNTTTRPSTPAPPRRKAPSFAYLPDLDINTATEKEWKQLPGIGDVLSKRIVKYREAKGGFREVDEIKDVYGLPTETFDKIVSKLYLDTLTIPLPNTWIADNTRGLRKTGEEQIEKNEYKSTHIEEAFEQIDLNLADEKSLEALPGIGDKLAGRIVRFRKILGYYASVDQLRSIYGLSEENFNRVQPFLYANIPADYEKKDLNAASKKLLAAYPAISEEFAEKIAATRKKLGWFESWEQVQTIEGMDQEILKQLQAYFFL